MLIHKHMKKKTYCNTKMPHHTLAEKKLKPSF